MKVCGICEKELIDLFPFRPKSIMVEGKRLSYIDEGARSGETVLLLHGNPTWSFMYRKLINPLAVQGYRIVAPDLMGFGRSEKPLQQDYYHLKRHVNHIVELIRALGLQKITLVVHDWGGPIGFGAASVIPELFQRLVIMNTWLSVAPNEAMLPFHYPFRQPFLGETLVQGGNLFVETAIPLGTLHLEKLTEHIMDGYRWPFPSYASRTGILAMVRDVPAGPNHQSTAIMQSIQSRIPQLHIPAIFIWGKHDPVIKLYVLQHLQSLFPQAATFLLEASHFVLEDQPEQVLSLIFNFLSTTP